MGVCSPLHKSYFCFSVTLFAIQEAVHLLQSKWEYSSKVIQRHLENSAQPAINDVHKKDGMKRSCQTYAQM
ncbi:hypothetical protein KIN20_020490 [Parelaphostrongylus tenuis]|uniref:Uncharacterized protein n=1 Tax=Parelaphostrongylus tenuis TaxID=148309 RepID=A0AAD5N9V5_PARTN|nr:hypothetical protein KIN20_020490 [Parelaphostrongylus tenuis]